ncbi:Plasmodium vivax Vir protein, putative [Plasmodium vivax]|uniref:Vir protein, putative n=1 Tax=Plasmodium vivax TaxID=5855 RepID=A0A1G4EAK7_PLAVI|nr:Plasmodium vivax Vir protein, putative [Plasmodium vivax]
MDKERFEEADKLYNLYDAYYYFKSLNIDTNQSELCNHFNDIVQNFNDLINNYNKIYSKHLFNKLYDLKCLIDKHALVSNHACQSGIKDLLSPKLYSSHTSDRCNVLEKELKAEGLSVDYPNAPLDYSNRECDSSSENFHFSCQQQIPEEYEESVMPKALGPYSELAIEVPAIERPGTEGVGPAETRDMQSEKLQRVDVKPETGDPRLGLAEEGISAALPTSAGLEVAGSKVSNELTEQVRSSYSGGEESNEQGAIITTLIGEPPESSFPKNIGTIGSTFAGSSLFLLMMYKYTPLGSWVSTKILRKDKLIENMRKNNYELLLNDVGNHEATLNDTMYHISYNSSSNQ